MFSSTKLKRRMEEIESSINRYLTALDAADRQEPTASESSAMRLEEKIAKLKTQMKELQAIEIQLNGQQAREAIASETLSVVADRGYFKSGQILACHDAGITAYVPKPMTSGAKADGRFNNDAFIYEAAKNEYICPAGEALIWGVSSVEKGLKLHRYWRSNCQGCVLKSKCTPSKQRRVRRWVHKAVLEEMQNKLSNALDMMRVCKRTFEHPFGTLKQWMGATHFLTRKLNGVSAEMSLNVLAYNLKRVMKILGTSGLMKTLSA